jgi:hypothetical protein
MKCARSYLFVLFSVFGVASVALGQSQSQVTEVGYTVAGSALHIGNFAGDTIVDSLDGQLQEAISDTINPVSLGYDGEADAGAGHVEVHIRAFADIGSLAVGFSAAASGTGTKDGGSANVGQVHAGYNDKSIIRRPGLPNGRLLRVKGWFDITGEMGVHASGGASGRAELYISDFIQSSNTSLGPAPYVSTCGPFCRGYISANPPIDLPPPVSEDQIGTIFVTHNMTVGQPYSWGYFMEVKGQAHSGGGSVLSVADFEHTFRWGGIESVIDTFTGQPLEGWTIESESGFDYSKSYNEQVPEPSSIALLSVASCFLLRRARTCV